MPACTGDCLEVDDGGVLQLSTGTFGQGDLEFEDATPQCVATGGMPIYCDGAGTLRTAPFPQALCGRLTQTQTVGTAPGTASNRVFTIGSIRNESACYYAALNVHMNFNFNVDGGEAPAQYIFSRGLTSSNGDTLAAFSSFAFKHISVGPRAAIGDTYSESYFITLAPGETRSFDVELQVGHNFGPVGGDTGIVARYATALTFGGTAAPNVTP